jgi:hypothetical protein
VNGCKVGFGQKDKKKSKRFSHADPCPHRKEGMASRDAAETKSVQWRLVLRNVESLQNDFHVCLELSHFSAKFLDFLQGSFDSSNLPSITLSLHAALQLTNDLINLFRITTPSNMHGHAIAQTRGNSSATQAIVLATASKFATGTTRVGGAQGLAIDIEKPPLPPQEKMFFFS